MTTYFERPIYQPGDWVRVVHDKSCHYNHLGQVRLMLFSDVVLVYIDGVTSVYHIDSLVPFSGHGPGNAHMSQELPP